MKITEDERKDIFGQYPVAWITGGKDLQKIQDYLWNHYNGYKFVVIFDCTKDEYEEIKETPVYFLDCIFDEMLDYIGIENAKEIIARKETNKRSR